MWSDNESDVDLLQFRYLASAVTDIIANKELLPTTIGVYGDWGSGKSTLIRMVDGSLAGQKSVLRITFNGWLFEGYEDAKTALLGSILDAVQTYAEENRTLLAKGWDGVASALGKLRRKVNLLHLSTFAGRYVVPAIAAHQDMRLGAAALAGVAITDVAHRIAAAVQDPDKKKALTPEEIEKLLRETPEAQDEVRRTVREFRADFADLLAKAGLQTVVVFIDDLDRCLPDTIIETLEAIRLFLFVPGTVFIIGADERLVEYAVRRRFPELQGTNLEVGRNYLEKLVQIPVRIPPLSPTEIESYMNLLFARLRADSNGRDDIQRHLAGIQAGDIGRLSFDTEAARKLIVDQAVCKEIEDDLDFVAQIAPILAPGMGGNPRRTKRFLNAMLLRLSLGHARGLTLRRPVLAKLMLLEYLRPEFFRQLAELQSRNEGHAEGLDRLEGTAHRKGTGAETKDGTALESPLLLWEDDEWMKTWLHLQPPLRDVDLRPYFYVAHDRLGPLVGASSRLSRLASEALERLVNDEEMTRKVGLKQCETLVSADIGAIFETLADRLRRSDALDQSPFAVMLELAALRQELMPQFLAVCDALPDTKLKPALVPQIWLRVKDTPHADSARRVFVKWGRSSRKEISAAVETVLNPKKQGR